MPSLRKAGHPEPTLLLLGSFVLTCGRATLAFATTVPHLMLGELLVVLTTGFGDTLQIQVHENQSDYQKHLGPITKVEVLHRSLYVM